MYFLEVENLFHFPILLVAALGRMQARTFKVDWRLKPIYFLVHGNVATYYKEKVSNTM